MTLKLSIVVGNPKPKSRTLKVAAALGEKLFGCAARDAETIDLIGYKDKILSWPSETMDALNARVWQVSQLPCRTPRGDQRERGANNNSRHCRDISAFASPTYKAT
jgi:hypothetical protein